MKHPEHNDWQAAERDIAAGFKSARKTNHPTGEIFFEEQRVYRVKVLLLFLVVVNNPVSLENFFFT